MTQQRWIALHLAMMIFLNGTTLDACTFCAGSVLTRQTFREYQIDAKFVAFGTLSDAKPDPSGLNGTTAFAAKHVYKGEAKPANLIIPRYLPIIGNTSTDYLVFGTVNGAEIEPLYGVTATPSMLRYLEALNKLPKDDTASRWKFYFTHLDSEDKAIAADAFLEFAKAPDAEITKHKSLYVANTLRRLMTAQETPSDRLGVFALMLGLSGNDEDMSLFEKALTSPIADRVQPNISGYLAGLTLLDAKRGWAKISTWATDASRPYAERLSAVNAMQYFQATKPKEAKSEILQTLRLLISTAELADIAIEDLRRWEMWDETPLVLSLWEKSTHRSRLIRRSIVHFALVCPKPEAKEFLNKARTTDAKLVATVEELLQIEAENKKP